MAVWQIFPWAESGRARADDHSGLVGGNRKSKKGLTRWGEEWNGLGMETRVPYHLLACSVFDEEIACHGSGGGMVSREDFEMGLHDQPERMRAVLQEAIERAARREDIGAVVLAYGLCGLGTAGLRARGHPLVMARAHDCVTVLLGSKEAYAGKMAACPGCYFYSPGWNRGRRVPGPERLGVLENEWSGKFDPDDIAFLLESERAQWAMHEQAVFVHLGTPGVEKEEAYARGCADWLGWKFESVAGDPTLLRDLLSGNWDDDRFLIVPPGSEIAHSADQNIVVAVAREEPR